MTSRRWTLGLVPLVLASAAVAGEECNDLLGNGSIAVYSTQNATSQCIVVPNPPAQITFYVCATLQGQSAPGITGAEFRVEANPPIPPGFLTVTRSPLANIDLGTLIVGPGESGGVNIAFPACQPGPVVLLYSVNAIITDGTPIDFVVKPHSTPSNPNYRCPIFVNCSAPVFGIIQLTPTQDELLREPIASRSFLRTNAAACGDPCAPVAVERAGWTGIKSLYRD